MGGPGITSQDLDTRHNIYPGRQPLFPLELILRILQHLKGKHATLFQLSLTCKVLHAEARHLLYCSINISIGAPPESYIRNPSLAKFIRTITYVQSINVKRNKAMEKIISGSFAHRMPNLKSMTLTLERSLPKDLLSKGDFQLEELSLGGEYHPDDLEATLGPQKKLKKLRIMDWIQNPASLPLPLSVCPELHTLEADISVIEAFLPLHNIHTLIWELWYYDSSDHQLLSDHLAKGLRGLKRLCYPLAANLPTLQNLTKYLNNLQYLAIEHSINMGNASIREYSILTDLPEDLSAIPCLRGLVLSSSHSYRPSDITNDFMEGLFQACPCLEFVDAEIHGRHYPRRFARWVRGSAGDVCTREEGPLAYRKLADCFQYLR